MRYRIEYLLESTEEDSVCYAQHSEALTLGLASNDASDWLGKVTARVDGYQIRDMDDCGAIVLLRHLYT